MNFQKIWYFQIQCFCFSDLFQHQQYFNVLQMWAAPLFQRGTLDENLRVSNTYKKSSWRLQHLLHECKKNSLYYGTGAKLENQSLSASEGKMKNLEMSDQPRAKGRSQWKREREWECITREPRDEKHKGQNYEGEMEEGKNDRACRKNKWKFQLLLCPVISSWVLFACSHWN